MPQVRYSEGSLNLNPDHNSYPTNPTNSKLGYCPSNLRNTEPSEYRAVNFGEGNNTQDNVDGGVVMTK